MEKSKLIKDSDKDENVIKKEKQDKRLGVVFVIMLITLLLVIGAYLFVSTSTEIVTKKEENKANLTSPYESFVFKTIKGQTFQINASPNNFEIPKMKNRIPIIIIGKKEFFL